MSMWVGLLVSMWVGLLARDVADACSDDVDMFLLPVKPVLLKLLLSLLILADEDLHREM